MNKIKIFKFSQRLNYDEQERYRNLYSKKFDENYIKDVAAKIGFKSLPFSKDICQVLAGISKVFVGELVEEAIKLKIESQKKY